MGAPDDAKVLAFTDAFDGSDHQLADQPRGVGRHQGAGDDAVLLPPGLEPEALEGSLSAACPRSARWRMIARRTGSAMASRFVMDPCFTHRFLERGTALDKPAQRHGTAEGGAER